MKNAFLDQLLTTTNTVATCENDYLTFALKNVYLLLQHVRLRFNYIEMKQELQRKLTDMYEINQKLKNVAVYSIQNILFCDTFSGNILAVIMHTFLRSRILCFFHTITKFKIYYLKNARKANLYENWYILRMMIFNCS